MRIKKLVFVLILSLFSYVLAGELLSWKELNGQALRLYQKGKYMEATEVTKRALGIARQQFGSESLEAAESIGNLGALYEIQGKAEEAKPLYKQAGEIRAKYGKGTPLGLQTEVMFDMQLKHSNKGKGFYKSIYWWRMIFIIISSILLICIVHLFFKRRRRKFHSP